MNYPACITCGRPMRRARQLAKDHPGTVAFGGKGTCKVCRTQQLRAPHDPIKTEVNEFHLAVARTALNGFLAERNKRLGVTA